MLQDMLMSKLIDGASLGQKIQTSDTVSDKGQFALDATEKNPNVEGSLAGQIVETDNKVTMVQNTINSIIALPDGASTAADGEIAAAKVGPTGEQYTTLQQSIQQQINNYKDVAVSNDKPSADSRAKIWVNTSNNATGSSEGFEVPQIDDGSISTVDTWSSYKIRAAISEMVKLVVDDAGNATVLANLINDVASGNDTTWSSEKIENAITQAVANVDLSTKVDKVDGSSLISSTDLAQITTNKNALSTLNGEGTGSIDKMIDVKIDAWAATLTDDETINTYAEALNWIATHASDYTALLGDVSNKVDKVSGKGLSTEDFTSELKGKVDNLSTGTDGQFAVSDGNNGIKWVTIADANNMSF